MIVAVNAIYAIRKEAWKNSGLNFWIFSGFFTQLHKFRSLRRSYLHFHFISFPQFIYDLFHISLTKKILMQMWICMNCPQKGLSIGLHSKHAWACWDSDRAIDFEIPRLTVNVHFPCNTWIYREYKVQNGLILWETLCNYLLACLLISWNNLLLPMEQLNFTRLILKFPDLL